MGDAKAPAGATLITGQAGKMGDCLSEWAVVNPKGAVGTGPRLWWKGVLRPQRMSNRQACTEGDASCDFDFESTSCLFRVGLCFAVRDPAIPTCPSVDHGRPVGWVLDSPRPRDGKQKGVVARALMEALRPLGAVVDNRVAFPAPIDMPPAEKEGAVGRCGPLVGVPVAVGTTVQVRGHVVLDRGEDRGGDYLVLECRR